MSLRPHPTSPHRRPQARKAHHRCSAASISRTSNSGSPSSCTAAQIQRYQSRISGPLLDRLDLHVRLHAVDPGSLHRKDEPTESTTTVASRVLTAREIQQHRQQTPNAHLNTEAIDRHCRTTTQAQQILDNACRRFRLTARTYHRLLKIARTIADLEASIPVTADHISEALLYRPPDPFNAHPNARDRSYSCL
jgi:magnesium chelatase family protein